MDITDFKRQYYLFDPKDFGKIFVFIDLATYGPGLRIFGQKKTNTESLWK